jgi:NADH-quinone oxidoreductase subunit D
MSERDELRDDDNGPRDDDLREDYTDDYTVVHMGPSHPAMHGNIHIKLTLAGEKIHEAQVNIGYLHRGFEKECEAHTWQQIFPYTDRLNYVSPMLNNTGYALAVEKLLGIEVPERAQYIRVLVGEIARIADHLTYLAAQVMEMGAFTPYFYCMKARELLYDILEETSGARLTHSYVRIGGVAWDLPDGFEQATRAALPQIEEIVVDVEKLVNRNRIFLDRMQGVAVISAEDAVAYGWTGPCLRGSGVDYDVRKDHPYLVYDRMDFEVPIGTDGDNMDRYLVRVEEIRQSMRIITQALDQLEPGPVEIDDRLVVMPRKAETYNTIEDTIAHFKLVIDGIRPPRGEVYGYTEAANGELGFYLVSDGTGRPVKMRCRPPCFFGMAALHRLIEGHYVADVIPTFDTINMIGGECDR